MSRTEHPDYVSPHCLHELHAQCTGLFRECPICEARCSCPCHAEKKDAEEALAEMIKETLV